MRLTNIPGKNKSNRISVTIFQLLQIEIKSQLSPKKRRNFGYKKEKPHFSFSCITQFPERRKDQMVSLLIKKKQKILCIHFFGFIIELLFFETYYESIEIIR